MNYTEKNLRLSSIEFLCGLKCFKTLYFLYISEKFVGHDSGRDTTPATSSCTVKGTLLTLGLGGAGKSQEWGGRGEKWVERKMRAGGWRLTGRDVVA